VNDKLIGEYKFIVDIWGAADDISQNEISWNSSSNGWNLNSSNEGIDNISIWTIDGKQLYEQKNINSKNIDIPLSVSKGLYIAQIQKEITSFT